MSRLLKFFSIIVATTVMLAACGDTAPPAPAPAEEEPAQEQAAPAEEEAAAETEEDSAAGAAAPAEMGDVVFFSTQFTPVEEQEKFRTILQEGGFDVTASEEGPLLDVVIAGQQAGQGDIDVIGALHGTFPPLAREDAMMNVIDVAEDLLDSRDLTQAYLETGLLGTDDYLYYVPWMQATYIMAAHNDAMQYLPDGANINALTWEEFGQWCQNIFEETGSPSVACPTPACSTASWKAICSPPSPVAWLKISEVKQRLMMEWARDSLWPYVNPQSINYEFMQEPLLAGEVLVAFDHTARLLDAFNQQPENFVAFPAPAGPAGRGFMPVIVGLGIPNTAPNPEAGAALIDYLTTPEVQGKILKELGFFPVVDGVDTSDLPEGIAIELEAVANQSNSSDALPALLPVGWATVAAKSTRFSATPLTGLYLNGEDIDAVLEEEGANLQALMDETGAPCWAPDAPSQGPCQVK
jgi:multiple sugar transport system substrate-binding protein